jgi:hypothetical protein
MSLYMRERQTSMRESEVPQWYNHYYGRLHSGHSGAADASSGNPLVTKNTSNKTLKDTSAERGLRGLFTARPD